MALTLVRATPARGDAGDRVSPDGIWSLTHELGDDDDTGDTVVLVVVTHLATGLQLTHPAAGVDDWLMSGVALAEAKAQAVGTFNGLALEEAKDDARVALVKLDLLLPAGAVDLAEYRCECGGYLAMAPGRRLVHVDACAHDINPTTPGPTTRELLGLPADPALPRCDEIVCDPADHRICLDPAPRVCGHPCRAKACAYAPQCPSGHEDCCAGHHGYGD